MLACLIQIAIVRLMPSSDELIKELVPVVRLQHFEYDYKDQRPGERSFELMFRRSSDRLLLSIHVGQGRRQADVNGYVIGRTSGAGGEIPERSPSNIPLGDRSFVNRENNSITACADGFFIGVDPLTSTLTKESVRDARVVEAASRLALAESIGSELTPDGRPTAERSNTNEHTHSAYEPLSTIVKRRSLNPSIGEWLDRCTLKIGRHKVELALASDFVLVDGKPITMEAFVARKNGDWMIPTKVLKEKGVEGL